MRKGKFDTKKFLQHAGVGVIGAYGGSVAGKLSVLAGLATIAVGVWKDEELAVTAGSAMFAGTAFASQEGKFADNAKSNARALTKGFASGLYLDKVPAVKEKLSQMGFIDAPVVDPMVMAQMQAQAKALNGLDITSPDAISLGSTAKAIDRIDV